MKSKTVSGDLTHLFGFGQRLPVGEVATGVGVTVEVLYGPVDAELLSFALVDYTPQSIRYNFTGGQIGVVYRVLCAIDTSADNVYYLEEIISVVGE